MAVLVGWNCCSVAGSCTAAFPAGAAVGSVVCSCIGCRSATGHGVSRWESSHGDHGRGKREGIALVVEDT